MPEGTSGATEETGEGKTLPHGTGGKQAGRTRATARAVLVAADALLESAASGLAELSFNRGEAIEGHSAAQVLRDAQLDLAAARHRVQKLAKALDGDR